MKRELELQENLSIHQAEALDIDIDKDGTLSITTQFDDAFRAKTAVLATGTFLSGKLHYGSKNFHGGRAGDPASDELPKSLSGKLGLRLGRLKTGTPPRILGRSIDFSKMEAQDAENPEEMFSFFPSHQAFPRVSRSDLPCYLVKSTKDTAEIVRKNIDRSPLYAGVITGIGTRYCPSFEDKISRFPHHETHQIYLEPEGEHTDEYYANGISTSLPVDVQIAMIRSLPGMENAILARYAYAIEYDFVFPDQIERSLRVKKHPTLFLAGQINGTSGYEEAAGQGILAGLNAARTAAGHDVVELGRETSYIGVMIDDLVTKDIIEPYRLFTSRAEYRLRLRQDNADLRLCPLAIEWGLLPEEKTKEFTEYEKRLDAARKKAEAEKKNEKTILDILADTRGDAEKIKTLPDNIWNALELDPKTWDSRKIAARIAVEAKYRGYIERETAAVNNLKRLEDWKIPDDFDYDTLKGLRNESRMKLKHVKPTSLAQASRIDGVTPAETALLQVHLKRRARQSD
jgi:tRNA uridine 5-carboxymethylaminomethyl modification enzyme